MRSMLLSINTNAGGNKAFIYHMSYYAGSYTAVRCRHAVKNKIVIRKDFGVFKEMSQYGTVMLCTHGGYDQRQDGSNIVHFRLYNRKVEKETAELKLDGLIKTSDAIWEGIEYFDFPTAGELNIFLDLMGTHNKPRLGSDSLKKRKRHSPWLKSHFGYLKKSIMRLTSIRMR